MRRSVIVFITVGTPPKADGQTDLAAVADVASGIAQAMERYTVVVNKSTVPVGTGEFVREVIERHQTAQGPVRRRVESRVPAGGLGHRRHACGPTGS